MNESSQVLTGALRDNHRAVYIGERSFGKGVIQYYFPMTDGSGLKLTVAKYLTPSRYDIAARCAFTLAALRPRPWASFSALDVDPMV
jgi:hypothetical protein